LAHRFGEVRVGAGVPRFGGLAGPRGGGQQRDAQVGEGRVGTYFAEQRQAVAAGHVPVDEGDGERVGRSGGVAQRVERLVGVRSGLGPQLPCFEHPGQHDPARLVVVDDEDVYPGEVAAGRGRLAQRARSPLEGDGEGECGSDARLAVHLDSAAHELDDPLGAGQAEAAPAEPAGGRRVDLGERVEQGGLGVGGDADAGVAHLDAEVDRPVAFARDRCAGHDLAFVGELHGVAEEVQQDLTQPARIAQEHGRDVGADLAGQVDALGVGSRGEELRDVLHDGAHVELRVLQFESPCFYAREVEDVVDDIEQRLGRARGGVGVLALLIVEPGAQEQGGHPHDAVHRGADLVAHVGDELRLQPGRLAGFVAGGRELGLGAPLPTLDPYQ
jgi:hypothetical protein